MSSDDLRGFLARQLGWTADCAVDHALRSLELAAAHSAALALCGTGGLVPIAHPLHRRTLWRGPAVHRVGPTPGQRPRIAAFARQSWECSRGRRSGSRRLDVGARSTAATRLRFHGAAAEGHRGRSPDRLRRNARQYQRVPRSTGTVRPSPASRCSRGRRRSSSAQRSQRLQRRQEVTP
jgi:hypothetical protein